MSEPQSIKFAHCDFIARHVRATVVVEVILFCMGREHRWRSPQRCFVVTSTFGNVCEIASMVVPSDINRPFSSYLYNFRAHTGIKSLSREHEGTLTQTELAIIVQIPLLGVSVLPNFGAVTADRALRSRLFRVRVGLRAQLQLSTSFSTFDRKKLNKNRRLRALRPP